MKRHYGKYRGTVLNNIDPLQMGRINVQVPAVTGLLPSSWALPCVPSPGSRWARSWCPRSAPASGWSSRTAIINLPIWVGGFWGSAAEVPALGACWCPGQSEPGVPVRRTEQPRISDLPGPAGGLLLKCRSGAFISISEAGIILSSGQGATITMTGPIVAVNQTALVVI